MHLISAFARVWTTREYEANAPPALPQPLRPRTALDIAPAVFSAAAAEDFMSVDADTVRRIAHLARIKVADDEIEHLRAELNAMLAFVEQLGEVNVEGVEPMTSVTPMQMKQRPDVVTDGGDPVAVLANAPATQDNFFLVPKVVE
jgi:aspartyl-tRNA(Asn)/glutamyl-tRNA(Gln) amidotransferase subunit C